MNYKFVRYIIGWIIGFEAAFLLLPAFVSLIYNEHLGFIYLGCALVYALIAYLFIHKQPARKELYAREGFVAVALSWIVLSVGGAIPLVLTHEIPSFTDALFEIISGFTTTGSSILVDVEALSHASLFWRSFTHWVGGMGVLVFIIAILPLAGGYNMHLMKAESPGPTVGKLTSKIGASAQILYGIYIALSFILFVILVLLDMPVFDALCTTFGTAGTGGFGVKADSIASYSYEIQFVVATFMAIFAINFNIYYLFLIKRFKEALASEELKVYGTIVTLATVIIMFNIFSTIGNYKDAFIHAYFQVTSIMSSTGFATFDYNDWPSLSKTILISLMFIGACAGSTGGGFKVSRVIILFKQCIRSIQVSIRPRSVKTVQMDGKTLDNTLLTSVNNYLIAYVFIIIFSVLFISLDNFDFATNFSAVMATFNNIGPGLNIVSPSGNFSMFSDLSKYVLMFDMLAGRLEIYPMLVLFSKDTWRS